MTVVTLVSGWRKRVSRRRRARRAGEDDGVSRVRRLVASASVFPKAENASMVVRLTAAGALVARAGGHGHLRGLRAVLRESRCHAGAGDPRSKLRTSRHARATSSPWPPPGGRTGPRGSRSAGARRTAARRARPPCRSQ